MIVTGIIREINISDGDLKNNKYKVEVNYFQNAGDTDKSHYTFNANACTPSGMYSPYAVGDKVYVSFINENQLYPVILGKIYQGISDEARSFAYLDSLAVKSKVSLPETTTIGDIDYTNIKRLLLNNSNFVNEEILIGKDRQCVSSGVTIKDLERNLNYSTEEQIAGKWIDGSIIYKKSFEATGIILTSYSTTVFSNTGIQGDHVIRYEAMMFGKNGCGYSLPGWQLTGNTSVFFNKDESIQIWSDTNFNDIGIRITVYYTKSN